LLWLRPLPWLSLWLWLWARHLLPPPLRPLWLPLRLSLLLLVMLLKRPCLALLPLRSLPQPLLLLRLLLLRWLMVMLCLQSRLLRPLVWALLRFR
jgi:hypothetical protein